MNNFSLSLDDWSNVYYVRYSSGTMGDFLASLLIYSFKKKYLQSGEHSVERFEYLPFCKRWVSYSSDVDQILKNFTVLDETLLYNQLSKRVNNQLPFIIINEKRLNLPNDQCFKNINLIRPVFAKNLSFMATLMKIYKHSFDITLADKDKLSVVGQESTPIKDKFVITRPFFNEACMKGGDPHRNDANKIKYSNLYKIDIFKLIFDKDTQGLEDIIDINDIGVINILNIAQRDVLDIAEYFNIDFMEFYKDSSKIIEIDEITRLFLKCQELSL